MQKERGTSSQRNKKTPADMIPSHHIPSVLSIPFLDGSRGRSKLTHDNPPRRILFRVVGGDRVYCYSDRAHDRREYEGDERVFGYVRAVSALGETEGDFVA